jgi:hypothetical protein
MTKPAARGSALRGGRGECCPAPGVGYQTRVPPPLTLITTNWPTVGEAALLSSFRLSKTIREQTTGHFHECPTDSTRGRAAERTGSCRRQWPESQHGQFCARTSSLSIGSHAETMAIDRFTCQGCGAQYAIKRRHRQPDRPPACEDCEHPFPRIERGYWLRYMRTDPVRFTEDGVVIGE